MCNIVCNHSLTLTHSPTHLHIHSLNYSLRMRSMWSQLILLATVNVIFPSDWTPTPPLPTPSLSSHTPLPMYSLLPTTKNKDKYHSSHTHSTDCCLQRWLPISPRGSSGHRGDSKDWSRLWGGRKEWSGAPRPGPPHGGPSLPSGKLLLLPTTKQSISALTYSLTPLPTSLSSH